VPLSLHQRLLGNLYGRTICTTVHKCKYHPSVPQRSHRDQLLEGAIECLKTKGYARTTARDIAAAADANLASIGYHFGSKEALLDAAVAKLCQESVQRMGEAAFADEGDSPLGRMGASWAAMLQSFEGGDSFFGVYIDAACQARWNPALRKTMVAQHRHDRDAVAEMVKATLGEDAEKAGADPRVVASFLIAVYDGFALQWLLDPDEAPKGEELLSSLGAALAAALESAAADPA
jgi:AcrR family transcriptional regulator